MPELLLLLSLIIVTYVPRALPIALAHRLRFGSQTRQALALVPIAVLTAIVVQTVFVSGDSLNFTLDNNMAWAALAAALIAHKTNHLFFTVAGGLSLYTLMSLT